MRKIVLLLLASFLFFSIDLSAQNNLPPAYEITTDSFSKRELDKQYWQILEDPKNELTIEQVSRSAHTNNFHLDSTKDSKINLSINTYWFRYRLKNVMGHNAKICLITDANQSDYFLFQATGKFVHKLSGLFVPWKRLDGLKLVRAIPVEIKPGEELIIYNQVYYRLGRPLKEFSIQYAGTDEYI